MERQEALSVLYRVIYKDADFALVLNWLGLGALISIHRTGFRRRAHALQKTFFLRTVEAVQALGEPIQPDGAALQLLARTFAEGLQEGHVNSLWFKALLIQGPESFAKVIVEAVRDPGYRGPIPK